MIRVSSLGSYKSYYHGAPHQIPWVLAAVSHFFFFSPERADVVGATDMGSSSSIVVGWKVLGFFSTPRFSRLRCCSSGPSLLIGALDHLLRLCHKQSLLSRLNSRSSSSDYRWKQTLENRLRMFLVNRVHLRPSGKPY